MIRFKVFFAAAAIAALPVLGLCACSSADSAAPSAQGSSSQAAQEQASSSAEPELAVVGEPSDDGASFELANKTGKAVTALAVKSVESDVFPDSLIASGDEVDSGDAVVLACPAIDAPEGTDLDVKPLADISLTLSDGSEHVLHQVDVYSIEAAELRLSDGLAYLDYETESGESVSTLESEKAIAQQAADEAAAAEAAEAEAAAAAEAAYDDSSAYVDDSAVGSGDEAECVPDIVLR